MMTGRTTLLVLTTAVLVSLATVQGRELLQVNPALTLPATGNLACQVTFFDDDFEGGSQEFDVDFPADGSACSACTSLNLIRTNSWESYISNCGRAINLYDGRSCDGTTSGPLPASSGVIKGSLSNSVDSFILCP